MRFVKLVALSILTLFAPTATAWKSKSGATASTAVVPAIETIPESGAKKRVFTRRPSVDTGLRYSSSDWITALISTPTSYVLSRIRSHFWFNVAISIAVVYFYHYENNPHLAIPMTGHSLLGSSLGLLLSYRTNSAYARFWEARGHWTKTKATCRNLALTIQAHIAAHSPRASERFLELLAAYPLTLMHLCLGGAAQLSDEVQRYIPHPSDADQFYDSPALPAVLRRCMQLRPNPGPPNPIWSKPCI